MDFIGKGVAFHGMYNQFVELLERERAECISFPCDGLKYEDLYKGGFRLRDESDIILPVYYEPFVKSNVELDYHFYPEELGKSLVIVKGDADQDRPNII